MRWQAELGVLPGAVPGACPGSMDLCEAAPVCLRRLDKVCRHLLWMTSRQRWQVLEQFRQGKSCGANRKAGCSSRFHALLRG